MGETVNSDTYKRLPEFMRQQADAIAAVLVGSVGGYIGSEQDARTDATAIVLAARFTPMGDNHHRADLCPYCTGVGE